ncbi:MAG: two-component system LytT family response regulator [Crocinitomix sp.]|jgi:two-component system LytT family response regulator
MSAIPKNKISAIIIDDEKIACKTLSDMLRNYCPDIDCIQSVQNPETAIEMIGETSPDILFLDINMPQLNGFELLERLGEFKGKIVFTTAYHEYAVKAFQYNAFDYLLKPIHVELLEKTVERVKNEIKGENDSKNLISLAHQLYRTENYQDTIAIHDKDGLVFISITDISYLKGESNYTVVHCNQNRYMVSKTLKDFEETLNPKLFLRVHKSYLVHIEKVVRYMKTSGYLVLQDDKEIPVSRRKRQLLDKYIV